MIAGMTEINDPDLHFSQSIFEEFYEKLPNTERAFEIACGIGRITKHIIQDYFENYDVLD